jgi:hypothetical protein
MNGQQAEYPLQHAHGKNQGIIQFKVLDNQGIFQYFDQHDQQVKQREPRILPGKPKFEILGSQDHEQDGHSLYDELDIQEKNQEYQQLNVAVFKYLPEVRFCHGHILHRAN